MARALTRAVRTLPLLLALILATILAADLPLTRVPLARAEVVAPPPALGDVIAEEALTEPGVFRANFCPTGRSAGTFAADGYRIAVTGPCAAGVAAAGFVATAGGAVLRDGEVEFELHGAGALDRGVVQLYVRMQSGGNGYRMNWSPALGVAAAERLREGRGAFLAERTDLPPLALGDGARLGVRTQGASLWLLLNGEPVLHASDPADDAIDEGRIGVGLVRVGAPDDPAELSVTWRRLRLTRLAEGDLARAPTFARAGSGTGRPVAPPAGTPPTPGAVLYEEPMNAKEYAPNRLSLFLPFECPTGRGRSEFVSDGFRMETRGKCYDNSQGVTVGQWRNLFVDIPDGELRFDFKVVRGWQRSGISVDMRAQKELADGSYGFALAPGLGVAVITKLDHGENSLLARRADLGGLLNRDGWNSFAVRMLGPQLWLLLNDQPVLKAEDGAISRGGFTLAIDRLGNPDDDEHLEVVFASFRISEIKGAPKSRRPAGSFIDLFNLGR